MNIIDLIERAEAAAFISREKALGVLRTLSLEQFSAWLWSLPDARYPALSVMFPAAPSEETQILWTGWGGDKLLRQSTDFIRAALGPRRLGASVNGSERVLDFGSGYGRMLRILEYFYDVSSLYGCDPWDRSLAECETSRVRGDIRLSDWIPKDLPFDDNSFDFVYSYSVFTHLHPEVARIALETIRRKIKPTGQLIVTIRPHEFWSSTSHLGSGTLNDFAVAGASEGVAFRPQPELPPTDGIVTYGDTSMSLDYLQSIAPGWQVTGSTWTKLDHLQTVVYLTPV